MKFSDPREIASLLPFLILCLILPTVAPCQDSKPAAASAQAGSGERVFDSRCAACHGLDGRGGEHAPGIARNTAAATLPDQALSEIIHDGIPAKGMPNFSSLGDQTIHQVIAYLRWLQGGPQGLHGKIGAKPLPGDPTRGEALFFGKGGCSNCHVMNGNGRFIASDLSDFARHHTPNDIREAIVDPEASDTRKLESVTVITREGKKLAGIVRDEDNFSLQLQDGEGQFHLVEKSAAAGIDRAVGPSMPGDYAKQLSSSDVNDLVSYVARQATGELTTPAGNQPGRITRH